MTSPPVPLNAVASTHAEPTVAKPQVERDKTDESLRNERNNIDDVIAQKLVGASEKVAAEVVERARDQADAVLVAARDKADDKVAAAEAGHESSGSVTAARRAEDRDVAAERCAADALLAEEHAEQVRAQAALLPQERETTDRDLLIERARADNAVSHRDDFLGIVSHDLRNFLNGILLNVTVIADDIPQTVEGERIAKSMASIRRYVGRMDRLIGDLLDVVSIDVGKLAVERQRGDLDAILREAVDSFASAAADKHISLRAEGLAAPLPADIDHGRMLQVLGNLIGNAIKFTPQGGTIAVGAIRDSAGYHITVSDTGVGIAPDVQAEIFERFSQGSASPRKKRSGVGLGLYIARCIVLAHDGKIWVDSGPAGGSIFHVTLPGAVE